MRARMVPALLALACALPAARAAAPDADAGRADREGFTSRVVLSGKGAVSIERGEPEWRLPPEEQQKIVQAITQLDTRQATPKNFKPAVGADIPHAVNIHAFPPSVLDQLPSLANHMYAHLDREIVLADPLALKAVAVIPLPESDWANENKLGTHEAIVNAVGGLAELSDAQLRTIYQGVSGAGAAPPAGKADEARAQPAPDGQTLMVGSTLPANVALNPLPPNVTAELPRLQGLAYAKLQDERVLLVDPNARNVVGVIAQEEGRGAPRGVEPEMQTRDPLRHLEESGSGSAYTGPHSIR